MTTTGQAVVIVMPTEEETRLVERIRNVISELGASWLHMFVSGLVLGVANLLLLLQLNRKGAHDYFFKVAGGEEAAIVATLIAFLILVVFWAEVAYLAYFRKHRRQRITELEQLAQDPDVWATVEKLRRIGEVVGPLERFDPVLKRLQQPNWFTRRHLAPLLRSF